MRKMVMLLSTALLMISTVASAGLQVIGEYGFREYDPSNFPPSQKLSYKIMKARCTKCHTLDRVVQAVETGIAPISWQPFDQNSAKTYGEKVMRSANRSMTEEEVKSVVTLMQWLISVEKEKFLPRDEE